MSGFENDGAAVLVTEWIEGWRLLWAAGEWPVPRVGPHGRKNRAGTGDGEEHQYGLDMSSWMHLKDERFSSAGEGSALEDANLGDTNLLEMEALKKAEFAQGESIRAFPGS